MGSNVPNQSAEKKSLLGDRHLAFVSDKDVAKGHSQWWRSDITEKIGTQTREDPGASSVMDGAGPVLSARVAGECNRVLGQEFAEVEERVRAGLARRTRVSELGTWGQFKVPPPAKMGTQSEEMADTRWVWAWKEVDGVTTVKAR